MSLTLEWVKRSDTPCLAQAGAGVLGPTHCDTDGRMVVAAQYGGGGVTGFRVATDGSLLPAVAGAALAHGYASHAVGAPPRDSRP